MRFTIMYHNNEKVRGEVMRHLPNFIAKGMDFSRQGISIQLFTTRPAWPTLAEMRGIPLSTQCEEVEWDGQRIVSIRKLVIDAELVLETNLETKAA